MEEKRPFMPPPPPPNLRREVVENRPNFPSKPEEDNFVQEKSEESEIKPMESFFDETFVSTTNSLNEKDLQSPVEIATTEEVKDLSEVKKEKKVKGEKSGTKALDVVNWLGFVVSLACVGVFIYLLIV